MKSVVICILICSVVYGCNNSKMANEMEKTPVFIFQETACFGQCPVHTMRIYENGYINYKGKAFVEKEGVFEKTISKNEVERLINIFNEAGFFEFEDEYTARMTDKPTVYTTFNHAGKSKKIRNYHGAPEELRALEKKLRKIAMSQDGWKEIKE